MSFLQTRRSEKPPRRDPFRKLYQSTRWQNFSRQFLKENRLCAECLKKGITEASEVTDHVIPLVIWTGDPYDLSNLQPLSKVCHNRKTASENKGWNKK